MKLKKPKADKVDQPRSADSKSDKPIPFWVTWRNRREQKKGFQRESSIAQTPMSKEDKLKLLVCAVIVILIPVAFYLLRTVNSQGVPAK
jgi:hypothetical protein